VSQIDLANLPACIEDVRQAGLDSDPGPDDPLNYHQLLGRLTTALAKLPPLYRQTVGEPYRQELINLGEQGFNQVLIQDPPRERAAGLMLDIAHAILQNGEDFEARATDGYQEVISDLYDGFLSAEDRVGVLPPDLGVVAPLVKWGRPDFGPYTWPIDATRIFGCGAAVVSLPPANARRGLLAWAALGHETAGHDILHADIGLQGQLTSAVRQALLADQTTAGLAAYWADRIDETASDVLGILNMGPAAGIGLIGYFRGLNAAFGGAATLRNEGPSGDPHPADIVRGYLAAETVRLLEFDDADDWAQAIEDETDKDVTGIRLAGVAVTKEKAKASARVVAEAIAQTPLSPLEQHTLASIQTWRNTDEAVAQQLKGLMSVAGPLPSDLAEGIFAAHLVAAATIAALSATANLAVIFGRMTDLLKVMHDKNPSWGPLFVRNPGNIAMHRTYVTGRADPAPLAGTAAAPKRRRHQ